MPIVTSDADRDVGLIYTDPSLDASPSTHALIIGVGQYLSDRLLPVSSPPIAARSITNWLLEKEGNGFNNAQKPLGSVALLLSELSDGARSVFATAPIPRATFANVKKAVRMWVSRARSHPENFLLLFISSHGESFGRRTAFLLEDYGTDRDDITAGMSEVEQFVEALASINIEQQLLIFDCCRTRTPLNLRFDQQFGAKLINPESSQSPLMQKVHVLRSTGLGFEAYGRRNAPTLFAEALLDALRGLAATPNDGWTIDTYSLARTVASLIALHARDSEHPQQPDSRLSAPFVITTTAPTEVATVFVSLGYHQDFSRCLVRVTDNQNVVVDVVGSEEALPFARLELLKYKPYTITAFQKSGDLIGQTRIEPLPPVAFREIPEKLTLSRSAGARSLAAGMAHVAFAIASAAQVTSVSLVATLSPFGEHSVRTRGITLAINKSTLPIAVTPGWYRIIVASSDGRLISSETQVKAGTIVTVKIDPTRLVHHNVVEPLQQRKETIDHEYGQMEGGSIPPEPWEEAARRWLQHLGVNRDGIVAFNLSQSRTLVAPVMTSFFGYLNAEETAPASRPIPDHAIVSIVGRADGGLTIVDKVPRRFPRRATKIDRVESIDRPVWVAACGPDWREIAAVPSLGLYGQFQRSTDGETEEWTPALTVNTVAAITRSCIASTVHTRQWSSLLSFLALRDFERSAAILDGLMSKTAVRIATLQKIENPLVTIASALIAVAADRSDSFALSEKWFTKLTNWFPQLPDGPVLAARYLLTRRRSELDREAAKAALLDAYHRGIPIFSLAVDWLAQGLSAFAKDADTVGPAQRMRRISNLCDPTRVFTVLRIPT